MSHRDGLAVLDVIVALAVVGLLMAIAVPSLQSAREAARDVECINNLRQIGAAAQSHESVHGQFPYTATTWWEGSKKHFAISPHRELVHHIDPSAARQVTFDDPADPLWHDRAADYFVNEGHRQLMRSPLPVFLCPSDSSPIGTNNYRANLGVHVHLVCSELLCEPSHNKGAFVHSKAVAPASFLDGLSTTVFFSERVRGDGDPGRYDPFSDYFGTGGTYQTADQLSWHCRNDATYDPATHFSYAGRSWLLGGWSNTWYNHIHPPNSKIPDCGIGPGSVDGGETIVAARSFHRQHVNALMADGAVHRFASGIDAELWKALGTRNGNEVASAFPDSF